VATVVEVEVNDRGEVRIPRVDMVVDAGLVVNPESTRAQFEGAAVFGTSVVRSGEITATKGAIDQSNFQDYPVARIGEAPSQTNVYIVDRDDSPQASVSRECRRCGGLLQCDIRRNRQASTGSANHQARLQLTFA